MTLDDLTVLNLFDLQHTLLGQYLLGFRYPWEALESLGDAIRALFSSLSSDYEERSEGVFVHKSARVAPTAFLGAPCIIDAETEVRHCAFVRGSALVGEGCVVGNSVELKNAVLFDGVQVPHFNYVGDSILGYKSHLGAGAVTSNVKGDRSPVFIRVGEEKIPTGRKKVGAMLGDNVEVGCNSVLNPGTVVGRRSLVYPLSSLRGAYPADSIIKDGRTVVPRR